MKTNASATMTSTTLLNPPPPACRRGLTSVHGSPKNMTFQSLENPIHPLFGVDILPAS